MICIIMLARCCRFVGPENESNPDWTSDNRAFNKSPNDFEQVLVWIHLQKL